MGKIKIDLREYILLSLLFITYYIMLPFLRNEKRRGGKNTIKKGKYVGKKRKYKVIPRNNRGSQYKRDLDEIFK